MYCSLSDPNFAHRNIQSNRHRGNYASMKGAFVASSKEFLQVMHGGQNIAGYS